MSRLLIAVAIAAVVSLVAVLVNRNSGSQLVSVRRNALPTRVPAVEVGLEAGPASDRCGQTAQTGPAAPGV